MNKRLAPACGLVCVALLLASCGDEKAPAGPQSSGSAAPSPMSAASRQVASDKGLVDTSLTSPSRRPVDLARQAVPGEFLVKFKPGASKTAISDALRKSAPQSVRTFRLVPQLRYVKLARGASAERAIAMYRARPDVEYVEPNYLRTIAATPDDPSFPQQWGLNNVGQTGGIADADIDAPEAWDITTGSNDVVVAIIDSGVDYLHADLAANIWSNPGECTGNGVDDDGNGYVDDCHGIDTFDGDPDPRDQNGHGTHVAGIVGATGNNAVGVTGVAWNVKILPCKFMNMFGQGSDAQAIECLEYVAALKARGVNVIASNNSWSGLWPGQALYDAIRAQMDQGILFVGAAGNSGWDNDGAIAEFPCSFNLPNILCVANYTDQDALASSSGFGSSTVHLAAPGTAIYNTFFDADRYDTLSGTSMAAPHVTGALVLLEAQQDTRDWRALKNLILAGVDLNSYGITIVEGRLNAHKSLTCSNTVRLARLRPVKDVENIVAVGASVKLQALHINCGAPNGNVTVTVNPGGDTVTLVDDGQGDDLAAGDGIYTGHWVPSAGGDYQLVFPEVVPDTVNFTVDAMLKPGFPAFSFETTGTYQGGPQNHTTVGNIDADPQLEILASGLASGPLYVYNHDGSPVAGWNGFGSAGAAWVSLGEFDGDASRSEVYVNYYSGGIGNAAGVAYSGSGQILPGWPADNGSSFPALIVDLNEDGRDDVVAGIARLHDGTYVPAENGVFPFGPTALADVDLDGKPDMFWGSNSDLYAAGPTGEYLEGFPVSDVRVSGYPLMRFPVLGDVDGDGAVEVVLASRAQEPPFNTQIHIFSSRGTFERNIVLNTPIYYTTAPVLADLDGDGIPEILVQSNTALSAVKGDGAAVPGWPVDLGDKDLGNISPVVGDVNGDGLPEVVTLTKDPAQVTGHLHVFDHEGVELPGFPKVLHHVGQGLTPAIADIDLDGRNDIVVAVSSAVGTSRKVWAYDLHGAANHGPIEWGQYMESPRHPGFYKLGKNLQTQAYLAVDVYGSGTVTASDNNIDCGSDCIERYAKGTTVTLTATPGADGRLNAWRGACTGTAPICVVNVSDYTRVAADFSTRTLSVTFDGPDDVGAIVSDPAGIDCDDGTCSAEFVPGTLVTLTAVPNNFGSFIGWVGDCIGGDIHAMTCQVRLDRARSITGIFQAKPMLNVSFVGEGQGRVTSNPAGIDCTNAGGAGCTAPFVFDSQVILTPVPANYRYRFSGWSTGCQIYQGQDCYVRMIGDQTAIAIFQPRPGVNITRSGTGSGTVTSAPDGIACGINCLAEFPQYSLVTLTATPSADSWLASWSGACSGSATTCNLNPAEMLDVNVVFDLKPMVAVVKAGSGSGTVTASPGGIDCGADCSERYAPATSVTLTATPATGAEFSGWSDGCGTTSTCVVDVATGDVTRTATFTLQRHALTVTRAGTGTGTVTTAPAGIDCGADCTEDYDYNTSVTLTAAAAAGSTFQGWSGPCTGTGTCTVTMDAARSATATFRTNTSSGSGGGKKGGGGRIDWILLALGAAVLAWRQFRAFKAR